MSSSALLGSQRLRLSSCFEEFHIMASLVRLFVIAVLAVTTLTPAAQADHRSRGSIRFSGGSFRSSGFGIGIYSSRYSSPRYYGGGIYPGWKYGYPYSYGGIGPSLSLRVYSGPSYYSSYPRSYYAPTYVGSSYYYDSTPSYVPNYVLAPKTVETVREVVVETPRPSEPTDGGPIVIVCPIENSAPVEYAINGHRFTMKPGQTQKFSNDRRWVIEFDQGAGRGRTKYTLNAGTFKFKQAGAGWDFVQTVERATSKEEAPPPPMDTPAPLVLPNPQQ